MTYFRFPAALLAAFVAASSTACDADDDLAPAFSADELVGAWVAEELTTDASTEIAGLTTPYTETVDSSSLTFTFDDDGTFTQVGGYRLTTVVYPGTDSAVTATEVVTDDASGTYVLDGEALVTTQGFTGEEPDSPVVVTYEVVDVEPGRLVLDGVADNTHPFPGAPLRIAGTVRVVLTR